MDIEAKRHEVILQEGGLVLQSELAKIFLICSPGTPYSPKYARRVYWRWIDEEKHWLAAVSDVAIEDVFRWSPEEGAYMVANINQPAVAALVDAAIVMQRMANPTTNAWGPHYQMWRVAGGKKAR